MFGFSYSGGQKLNFDLAYPSQAIPDNFFPSNAEKYGTSPYSVPKAILKQNETLSFRLHCKSKLSCQLKTRPFKFTSRTLASGTFPTKLSPASPTGQEEETKRLSEANQIQEDAVLPILP